MGRTDIIRTLIYSWQAAALAAQPRSYASCAALTAEPGNPLVSPSRQLRAAVLRSWAGRGQRMRSWLAAPQGAAQRPAGGSQPRLRLGTHSRQLLREIVSMEQHSRWSADQLAAQLREQRTLAAASASQLRHARSTDSRRAAALAAHADQLTAMLSAMPAGWQLPSQPGLWDAESRQNSGMVPAPEVRVSDRWGAGVSVRDAHCPAETLRPLPGLCVGHAPLAAASPDQLSQLTAALRAQPQLATVAVWQPWQGSPAGLTADADQLSQPDSPSRRAGALYTLAVLPHSQYSQLRTARRADRKAAQGWGALALGSLTASAAQLRSRGTIGLAASLPAADPTAAQG